MRHRYATPLLLALVVALAACAPTQQGEEADATQSPAPMITETTPSPSPSPASSPDEAMPAESPAESPADSPAEDPGADYDYDY